MELPDAGTKLRLVLDYLPCEACLAQPVADQELLCSVCARLDRQIAVRVGRRTTVLVERPSPPEAPIVIAPAAPTVAEIQPRSLAEPAWQPEPAFPRDVVVLVAGEAKAAPPGSIEVIVEPLAPVAALPALAPALAPVVTLAAAQTPKEEEEEEEELSFDDIVSFAPARDEFFDYKARKGAPSPPVEGEEQDEEREPEPARVEFENEPASIPEDDYVFRPPPAEEPARKAEEPMMADDIIPREEVSVEPEGEEAWAERAEESASRWGPAPDFLADEEPEPIGAQPEEEFIETEVVEAEFVPEEESIVEMDIVEEEPLEMEMVAVEEPGAVGGAGDLYRLRGFDTRSASALETAGIHEIAHLAGHDAGELAGRTGVPFERLQPWIQVADLLHEVGVPLEAANALVAAGVAGPRGLAEADPDEIVDRVAAFGGYSVNAREIRRWKRRA